MVSLMVSPSASPARYFPRLLGGPYTNLSWYSRGQEIDKSTVSNHRVVSTLVTQKLSHSNTPSLREVRFHLSGKMCILFLP